MRTLRLKISGLLEFAGLPPAAGAPDMTALETAFGYPVRTQEVEFKDNAGTRIQLAWTHGPANHPSRVSLSFESSPDGRIEVTKDKTTR